MQVIRGYCLGYRVTSIPERPLGLSSHSFDFFISYTWDFGNVFTYPLVNVYIVIENGPVEIVDLPLNSMVKMVIFHYVNVYQRVLASNKFSKNRGITIGTYVIYQVM